MTKLIIVSFIMLMAGTAWGGCCQQSTECDENNVVMLVTFQEVINGEVYTGEFVNEGHIPYSMCQCKKAMQKVKKGTEEEGVKVIKQECLVAAQSKMTGFTVYKIHAKNDECPNGFTFTLDLSKYPRLGEKVHN